MRAREFSGASDSADNEEASLEWYGEHQHSSLEARSIQRELKIRGAAAETVKHIAVKSWISRQSFSVDVPFYRTHGLLGLCDALFTSIPLRPEACLFRAGWATSDLKRESKWSRILAVVALLGSQPPLGWKGD